MASADFPLTRWSMVLTTRSEDATAAQAALAQLCENYWFPLYSYVRRSGKSAEDAEDLTQAFFGRLIEKDTLAAARSERGKLRSFLLTSLKNFLSDEWDKENALKRGGGKQIISIDAELAEEHYAMEPQDHSSPDRLFEKRWAVTLLNRVLEGLREHYQSSGKEALYEELHPFLAAQSGERYKPSAERLGMTENAVRVAIFRMRQRYATALREEISHTVDSEGEVAAEIDFLFQAVR